MLQHLPVLRDFEEDPSKTPVEQLTDLLEMFGRPAERDIPYADQAGGDMRISVGELMKQFPEHMRDGSDNPARVELQAFYYSVDPKLRRKGLFLTAENLLSLLLERLEFFEHLSRNVVRVCTGRQCPHFQVCRFKDLVRDVQESDGVLCAVERELIRHHVEEFVSTKYGKPSVDPRRPEMAFMFQQLVQLLVQQVRYAMYMQVEDLKVKQYDKLRQADGSEVLVAFNDIEHPLMSGWQKTTEGIQKVLQRMGRTPEFMQRQGLFIEEGEKADAERRAYELTRETFQYMLDNTDESDEGRSMLAEAIAYIDKMEQESD